MTKHFKAPQTDGGLLAEPATAEYERLVSVNRERLRQLQGHIGNSSWPELRQLARLESSGNNSDRPLIMAGHQPELYHPGVWVKNFILAAQAKRLNSDALNLIVDNDTFKIRSLMLPIASKVPDSVALETVPFDDSEPEVPYEEAYPRDWASLGRWPDQARDITQYWAFEPMYASVWPRIVACLKTGASYARAFVEVRQSLERRWGGGTPEFAVSQLAVTSSFRTFARHLMANAGQFATAYNSAIADYRKANGIRSKNHPAPELQIEGDLIETPFWTWRVDAPTRQRVFVRRRSDSLEIFAGLTERVGELPINSQRGDAQGDLFAEFGWKLRPRALTLTLFSRLAVGDLFIHGIGGGKYDEVTDEIIRRYFAIEPPEYAVISATIRLPLERFASQGADQIKQQRLMRDLHWNPQDFDEAQVQAPELVTGRRELVAFEPQTKVERRAWFRKLSAMTQELRPTTAPRFEQATVRMDVIARELEANKKLARRDFSWVLYPEEYLSSMYRRLMDG